MRSGGMESTAGAGGPMAGRRRARGAWWPCRGMEGTGAGGGAGSGSRWLTAARVGLDGGRQGNEMLCREMTGG